MFDSSAIKTDLTHLFGCVLYPACLIAKNPGFDIFCCGLCRSISCFLLRAFVFRVTAWRQSRGFTSTLPVSSFPPEPMWLLPFSLQSPFLFIGARTVWSIYPESSERSGARKDILHRSSGRDYIERRTGGSLVGSHRTQCL